MGKEKGQREKGDITDIGSLGKPHTPGRDPAYHLSKLYTSILCPLFRTLQGLDNAIRDALD